ncbi:hypothetical protein QM480_03395 [Flectobacillus sp. DC10W]|uniref:Outer membrane protein beta-barrel domain-containing protein n=1 Tax=Flectobacillus longus TaxID=2984207 RepID=A0ABT6YIC9_9BACT|nr:hypothetical protein [Flectobacillus longus]MDI9863355.1 hypothetical protein [Flectobacillus longus]
MRTNTSLSFISFLLLLFSFKTSFGQYGIRADGIVYVKNREAPIKGSIKFTDHYTKVSILKENEQYTTLPISQIDSVKTEGNYLFVVKEFKENPILLEASVIAPVSLFFSRKLQLYFYSKGKEVVLIPKDKLRGYLLVFFPDFSYTPKLRSAGYQKIKYKEEYLSQLVTTYNEEIYPKYYPKVYALPSQKFKIDVSPFLGMNVNFNNSKFFEKPEVIDYRLNLQPQIGFTINFEGKSRISMQLDTYWTKLTGELPINLGEKYTSMKDAYQYFSIGKFDLSGIGFDAKFKYLLGKTINVKHPLRLFAGPSLFMPLKASSVIYNTVPVYEAPEVVFVPQLAGASSNDSPNILIGVNMGLDSQWQLSTKYDFHVEAKLKYLQMPNSYMDWRGSKATYSLNSLQLGLGVFFTYR